MKTVFRVSRSVQVDNVDDEAPLSEGPFDSCGDLELDAI